MIKSSASVLLAVTSLVGCTTALEPRELEDQDQASADSPLGSDCYATRGGELVRLDLATEQLFPLGVPVDTENSLVVIGDKVLACAGGLSITDLTTGAVEQVGAGSCHAVASDGTRIWVQAFPEPLRAYASLDDLRADVPERELPAPYATRIGGGFDGHLLASWHSSDEVLEVDTTTGAVTPRSLPDYDGWIFGLQEVGDSRFVAGGWVELGIRQYTRATGKLERTLFPTESFQGLTCGELAPTAVKRDIAIDRAEGRATRI